MCLIWLELGISIATGFLAGMLGRRREKYQVPSPILFWWGNMCFNTYVLSPEIWYQFGFARGTCGLSNGLTFVLAFFLALYFNGPCFKRWLKNKRSAAKEKLLAKFRELHPAPKPAPVPA